MAVTKDEPRILTVDVPDKNPALPFGPLDAEGDRTLELALRRWVRTQTGMELGYVEQLYSFGDRFRDPREELRVLSIAYLALVREDRIPAEMAAAWRNVYQFLPWEDHRQGRPAMLEEAVHPALRAWLESSQSSQEHEQRLLRCHIVFGLDGAAWDTERVLERYELLYEIKLVKEAGAEHGLGRPMGMDHRRILATALARLRGKLRYRPVVFELLPDEFTLFHLQRVVESLSGMPLHKQNFRRLVEQGGLVEGTGRLTRARGRPAELFRFRREVLRERPAPGVGLPRI